MINTTDSLRASLLVQGSLVSQIPASVSQVTEITGQGHQFQYEDRSMYFRLLYRRSQTLVGSTITGYLFLDFITKQ